MSFSKQDRFLQKDTVPYLTFFLPTTAVAADSQ